MEEEVARWEEARIRLVLEWGPGWLSVTSAVADCVCGRRRDGVGSDLLNPAGFPSVCQVFPLPEVYAAASMSHRTHLLSSQDVRFQLLPCNSFLNGRYISCIEL